MKYAILLNTETAMNVPAAKSQISVFVCSSIGVLPLASSRQMITVTPLESSAPAPIHEVEFPKVRPIAFSSEVYDGSRCTKTRQNMELEPRF